MPDDIDDDVPVYFSPGDDSTEVNEDIDRKALLEDEPPIEWSRYKPEKTLEDASKEASEKGEVKIRGKSNKDKDTRITSFGLQSLFNIFSSLALIPTKGMTLPFISYGGSSMISSAVLFGYLLSLTRKKNEER